jgi:hypothetical protein
LLLIVRSFTCWGLCKQLSTSQTKDCDHASKSLGFPMLFVSTTWTISSITYFKKISGNNQHIRSIYISYTEHELHIQCKNTSTENGAYILHLHPHIHCIYMSYTEHIHLIYGAYINSKKELSSCTYTVKRVYHVLIRIVKYGHNSTKKHISHKCFSLSTSGQWKYNWISEAFV